MTFDSYYVFSFGYIHRLLTDRNNLADLQK